MSAVTITPVAQQIHQAGPAAKTLSHLFGEDIAFRLLTQCSIPSDKAPSTWQAQALVYGVTALLRIESLQTFLEAFFQQEMLALPDGIRSLPSSESELTDAQLLQVFRILQGPAWVPADPSDERALRIEVSDQLKTQVFPNEALRKTAISTVRLGSILASAEQFRASPGMQDIATAEYLAHSVARMPLKPGMLIPALDTETHELRLWKVVSGVDENGFGTFFLIPREADVKKVVFLARGTMSDDILSFQGNLGKSAGSKRCDDYEARLRDAFLQAAQALGTDKYDLGCYGHSQGGAIASVMATRLIEWALAASHEVESLDVVTFMAPGISEEHAWAFAEFSHAHEAIDMTITHLRVQADTAAQKDIVPTLGEVRLGAGCSPHVTVYLQTWEAPSTGKSAHQAMLFDGQSSCICLRVDSNLPVYAADIESARSALSQKMAHVVYGSTKGEDLRVHFAEPKSPLLPISLDQILQESAHLEILLDKAYDAHARFQSKMRSPTSSKAGTAFKYTFGKAWEEAKQSTEEVSSPLSDGKARAKGAAKLLGMGGALVAATAASAPVTAAVLGGGLLGTLGVGRIEKRIKESRLFAAFAEEHAEHYHLLGLVEPVIALYGNVHPR